MIRQFCGEHVQLVTQDDHARLAGELVARLGNSRFDGPDPFTQVRVATDYHDAGWPLHDDLGGELNGPTLNDDHRPRDVLEISPGIAGRIWRASADVAEEQDAYAGLLVSLHVFALSAMASHQQLSPEERYARRHDLFLMNQFQQDEIERQERLRRRLGLRTDLPLQMGLADPGVNRDEDRLRFNLAMLRLCDALSLDACEGRTVTGRSMPLHPKIGSPALDIVLSQPSPGVMRLSPWPFSQPRVVSDVPARKIRNVRYGSVAEFHLAYAEAEHLMYTVVLEPG